MTKILYCKLKELLFEIILKLLKSLISITYLYLKFFKARFRLYRHNTQVKSISSGSDGFVHDTAGNRYSRLRKLLLDLITTAECIHYICIHGLS